MALNIASIESILATIVAVLFAVAGVVNLAGRGAVKRDFARWGYPAWFQLLCGALELLSAAFLLGQQTRVLGLTLAGAIMIQGDQHYLTAGFSSGFGEAGLVVGLLSRGSPLAALSFALLFGCLRSGGLAMEMSAAVPSAIVVVCQGLIVIATAAASALTARRA